jgi:hypothetical protein
MSLHSRSAGKPVTIAIINRTAPSIPPASIAPIRSAVISLAMATRDPRTRRSDDRLASQAMEDPKRMAANRVVPTNGLVCAM